MNYSIQLQFVELLLILFLLGLMGFELFIAFRSRSWVAFYRPTLFVAAILFYYVLAGPLTALSGDGVIYRGLDHRLLLVSGWLAALVFYGSLLIGFYLTPLISRSRIFFVSSLVIDYTLVSSSSHLERLYRYGSRLCLLGLFLFVLVQGSQALFLLNPLSAGTMIDSGIGSIGLNVGPFVNYFNYSINLLIPGICLMSAAWYRYRRHTFVILIWISIAFMLFISLGFRYRLVLLAIPILLLWFFSRCSRPSFRILATFLAAFLALNGIIGLTRSYGRGLDLSKSENVHLSRILKAGLFDSVVFYTTSGVIDLVSKESLFIGPEPIINTLLFPIPRTLLPNKGDDSYTSSVTAKLYGFRKNKGTAILNYGEYFLMAGWPGVVAFSVVLGCFLRFLWNWFLLRQNDPFAQVIYTVSVSYLYVVISRGYMPQVVMLFMFSVAPLFWIYGHWTKIVYSASSASSLPPRITRS